MVRKCFFKEVDLFLLSYFRDDESMIYKSLGVGVNGRPLQKNVSLFSVYLHYVDSYLSYSFFGGVGCCQTRVQVTPV